MTIFFRLFRILLRKNIINFIIVIALILTIICGTLYSVFESMEEKKEDFTVEYLWNWEENPNDLVDGYWWSIVTMTTVGYGDKYPVSAGGRIIAIPLMIVGIGILGLLIGVIADFLLSIRSRYMKGYGDIVFKNHIIICGWNKFKVDTIIREIRSGGALSDIPIVLVNNVLEENPYASQDKVSFIKGHQSDAEVLKRAGIEKCSKAIILTEKDDMQADDTTILTVLQIESMNKDVFTCAELIDTGKTDLLRKANCDEIVAANDFSVKLLVQSIEDPGLSVILSDVISNSYGAQIDSEKVKEEFVGKSYKDMFMSLYDNEDKLAIALKHNNVPLVNPKKNVLIEPEDVVYYITTPR